MENETYDLEPDYWTIVSRTTGNPADDSPEAWIAWTKAVLTERQERLAFWEKVRKSGAADGFPVWVRAAVVGQVSRYEDDVNHWTSRLAERQARLAAEKAELASRDGDDR